MVRFFIRLTLLFLRHHSTLNQLARVRKSGDVYLNEIPEAGLSIGL